MLRSFLHAIVACRRKEKKDEDPSIQGPSRLFLPPVFFFVSFFSFSCHVKFSCDAIHFQEVELRNKKVYYIVTRRQLMVLFIFPEGSLSPGA